MHKVTKHIYRRLYNIAFLVPFWSLMALPISAQTNAYQDYIRKYAPVAMEQMHLYRIPASITLAQGLLESNAGRSRLAVKGNNHFGIKVGGDWTGPYIVADDDRPGEHFRKYRNAVHSYRDHSLFLQRPRYAQLFKFRSTDYKSWAHGLKRAGYATNPRYAHNLIRIIEDYNLHSFDTYNGNNYRGDIMSCSQLHFGTCNKLPYIIMYKAMNVKTLGRIVGISVRKLRSYNEFPRNHKLQYGDVVYLKKKKRKVAKELRGTIHVVKPNESLHSISQHYGVRMKTLLKRNPSVIKEGVKVGENIVL